MKPTVRDIAKKAGVSIASVSMVLNNKPSRITEATRQRILSAAEELGYNFEKKAQTRTAVQQLSSYPLIGVIRPSYNCEFTDACQHGIERYAYVHGYKVITCNVDQSTELSVEYLKVLDQVGAAGIIMMPPIDMNENNHNEMLGRALHETKKPFVLLDQAIDRVFCDFITADNKGGAYMATEYLIHQGYRNIGIIAGKQDVYTCRKRIEGYKEALAFYDISIKEENIFYGNYRRHSGYEGMAYLDKMGIQAVFVCSDEMAMGVYDYANDKGLSIGTDISVVGFDDSALASIVTPPMTSVNQSGELMGNKACEVLIKRIIGKDKEPIKNTYFGPRLIERKSVNTKYCIEC